MAEAAGSSCEGTDVNTTEDGRGSEKQRPSLIQRVETMEAVIELLLETLKKLSEPQLVQFKKNLIEIHFHRHSVIPRWMQETTDKQHTAFLVALTYGKRSVGITKEVLEMMPEDPVQSSRTEKKDSVDEHLSALIHKVATMTAVKELLLETLTDLSDEEQKNFKWFLKFTFFQRSLPDIQLRDLQWANWAEQLMDVMVETCGQQSVEVTKEVLMDMNRTDLVQRLSETSPKHTAAGSSAEVSGAKTTEAETPSLVEHWPALIQKVETMETVIELVVETLTGLSDAEFKTFKEYLSPVYFYRHALKAPSILPEETDLRDIVFSVVLTNDQQFVETMKKVLQRMGMTDLAQRLSDSSSRTKKKHSADEHCSTLNQKVATIAAVKQLLLETFNNLSDKDLREFKEFLQSLVSQKELKDISVELRYIADRREIVNQLVQTYGQQSVELTREVFVDMNWTDMVQKLSKPSSEHKEKPTGDEHEIAPFETAAAKAAVKMILLATLEDLTDSELREFEWLLQFTHFKRNLQQIPKSKLERADRVNIVDLIVETCGQQSMEVTREVLMDMNRNDLLQRFLDASSELQEKQQSKSLRIKLLETLEDLLQDEFERFKWLLQHFAVEEGLPRIPRHQMETAHRVQTVDLIVNIYGQQSVKVVRKVLKKMIRRDLVERLSDLSSGSKEEQPVDDHQTAPFETGVTMASLQETLLATLADLSNDELEQFKWFLQNLKMGGLQKIPRSKMETGSRVEMVDLMVGMYGQHSVKVVRDVLDKIDRKDLVQSLSHISSGSREKHSVDEHQTTTFEPGVTKTSVKKRLLAILEDLSRQELQEFKWFLQHIEMKEGLPRMKKSQMETADTVEIVELMVEAYGQQSVEVASDVLVNLRRNDLVQRLTDISPGSKEKRPVDEHQAAPFETGVTMASVKKRLLETLEDLSYEDLKTFKWFLQNIEIGGIPRIPRSKMETENTVELVDLIVGIYGQQSAQVVIEILKNMNMNYLVQRLSLISSGSKEKLGPVDEHQTAMFDTGVTKASMKRRILETLEDLSFEELQRFKWFLHNVETKEGLPRLSKRQIEATDKAKIAGLIVKTYGQQSVLVTIEVLEKVPRKDLLLKLLDISSGSKGPSRSSELGGCESIMQDSTNWTKVEPEVSSEDADELPIYSLQSGAGNFECSVSGLRWVCKEKISLKYQFCSFEEPMKRMERMGYMPAGPLMDIKVTSGKLDEVYLPHWICIDSNPTIKDHFAVLHIDDCGDSVEQVSEVTSSHIKLSEPKFSVLMGLLEIIWGPVDINCKVLIYKTNIAFLTLHVYLIPSDDGLQQKLDKRQSSDGFQKIKKPHPDAALRLNDRFILTADLEDAKIDPKNLMLRNSTDPNFFEVHIENPDTDFKLMLKPEKGSQPVWTPTIRRAEYQESALAQGFYSASSQVQASLMAEQSSQLPGVSSQQADKHFVDKHEVELINRVSNIGSILDELKDMKVIQQECYEKIRALPTTQEKIRALYSGPLKAAPICKDIFYEILEKNESYLIADLKKVK